MKNDNSIILIVIATVLSIVFMSCSKQTSIVDTAYPTIPKSTPLPSFSQLDQLSPRSPSATSTVKGTDAILTSTNVNKLTDSLDMKADTTVCWAIFKLGKYESDNYIVAGNLYWLLIDDMKDDFFLRDFVVWFGVSNYKTNSWQWIKHHDDTQMGIDFSQIKEASLNPKTGFSYLAIVIQGVDVELISIDITTRKDVTEMWQDTLAIDRAYKEPNEFRFRDLLSISKCQDKPMICFYQDAEYHLTDNPDLMFGIAKKSEPTNPDDWNVMCLANKVSWLKVDSTGLSEINGTPAFCYSYNVYNPVQESSRDYLVYCYARIKIPTTKDNWVFCPVNNYIFDGSVKSLIEVEKKPVFISNRDDPNSSLSPCVLNISKTSTPVSSEDWEWFDLPFNQASKDMCLLNGKLAIVYQVDGEAITFMQFNAVKPTKDDFTTHIVDPSTSKDSYTGIDIVVTNNKPIFCFVLFNNQAECKLRFAQALTSEPKSASDWKISEIDAAVNLGILPKLSYAGNKPVVAYSKMNQYKKPDFYIASSTIPEPSLVSDWQITKVIQDAAYDVNLTVINDKPVFMYYYYGQIFLTHRWIP